MNPLADILARLPAAPPMPLGPGAPRLAARALLLSLTPENMFPNVADRSLAFACIAGLWLRYNFHDESHEISQSISSVAGSWWHGILHRREPDDWNAKYWFRRVGDHAVCTEIGRKVEVLLGQSPGILEGFAGNPWSATDFVDLCERHRGTGTPSERMCEAIQAIEWDCLMEWCADGASGA